MKVGTIKTVFANLTTLVVVGVLVFVQPALANVHDVTQRINEKEAEIKSVQRQIDLYAQRIANVESSQVSLERELELIDNRSAKTELDIQEVELSVEKAELEVERITVQINETVQEMDMARKLVVSVLKTMHEQEQEGSVVEILFGGSLSYYFDHLSRLDALQGDLEQSVERLRGLEESLYSQRQQEIEKVGRMEELHDVLVRKRQLLEEERHAKEVLLAEAANSEEEFRRLVRELNEERQFVNRELLRLEDELQRRLDEADNLGDGPTILSWPVESPILTALFHDPSYPFRHLFEHSGLDMAVPQGSTVSAPAPGYVAFTRVGRSYGNYMMVIHGNGVATLYAHLSEFLVKPDQFVERGQPIARSGGARGSAGAGLSTGPHLHFEVREQGIPVNPADYLMSR